MILYYTHNSKPRGFTERCYWHHRNQAERLGQKFTAVMAEPFTDDDIVYPFDSSKPTYADIYLRILRGLEGVSDNEPVYLCEDDTLYPAGRYSWTLIEPQVVIYNLNLCYLSKHGYAWYMRGGIALSQLMGMASAVRYNIKLKLDSTMAGDMSCVEPCSGQERPYVSGTCSFAYPSVDFRTDYNATWRIPDDLEFFQDLDGWPSASELWGKLYEGEKI